MKIENDKITSNDITILKKSLKIINEHLEKENIRGQTAEKRANMLITFIGIGTTIVLALSKNFSNINFTMDILIKFLFVTTLIYLSKSIIYTLKIFGVRQIKRLTPEMINDIQDFSLEEALAYEVKWKIWEYNQMIPVNTEKLFWVSRGRRNIILAILSVLLMSLFLFLDKFINISQCWFIGLQVSLGIIILLFSFFVDIGFEKYSFWEFKG